MLQIRSAEFVISAARPPQFPKGPMPDVAFVGRSNVGKSSLLNSLTARKGLAKTSGTPGKTRQINFFRINDSFNFVDLPGYGYAQVSKEERAAWARLIESYLTDREQLRLVVALSDIRHEPTALDRELFAWLDDVDRPYIVVLTKYDKVSPQQAADRVAEVGHVVGGFNRCLEIIPFSSKTNHNRDQLLAVIDRAVRGRPSSSRQE
ncbi:MAG TPA: ribosome biogenesis GTP-binding protein YihA/YsxC [Candidatus Kapabacteria bacterium]|jgi:GTP-binding protein|nr:ribosome biogenesis GTP-binding protein YihA/YsxC [Candidatus Kapabacteria bacterium]